MIWVITDIVTLPHGDVRTNMHHSTINYINQKFKIFKFSKSQSCRVIVPFMAKLKVFLGKENVLAKIYLGIRFTAK